MFLRTQDEEQLTNLDQVQLIRIRGVELLVIYHETESYTDKQVVAEYATEERAMQELNEIHKALEAGRRTYSLTSEPEEKK